MTIATEPWFRGRWQMVRIIENVTEGVIGEFWGECDFEPDGQNVIDDYLKRRGWRESVPAKRYLQAHKKSVMSLYEVTETRPGRCLSSRTCCGAVTRSA